MYSMSIMDKINAYSIRLNGRTLDLFNRNLWFSSTSTDIENYATAVKNSPANPISSNAVMVYASIGADNQTLTLNNGTTIDLINSAPEYYFTDMVFIQQKYEEALVDLYYFRAECSTFEDRAIMDEAISGTYWVAQQNGITYTEEQIREKFLEQLDAQLDVAVGKYHRYWKNQGLTNIDSLTGEYVEAIRSYYLDPNLETFENILSRAFQIEEIVGEDYFKWWTLTGIVSDLSSGLGTSLIMHGNENKNKFTMAPRSVSPVEISRAEPVEVSQAKGELVCRG